jgi:hypothetical protein
MKFLPERFMEDWMELIILVFLAFTCFFLALHFRGSVSDREKFIENEQKIDVLQNGLEHIKSDVSEIKANLIHHIDSLDPSKFRP